VPVKIIHTRAAFGVSPEWLLNVNRRAIVAAKDTNNPFMTADELTEKVDRDVAFEAATKFAAKHVDLLAEIREKFPVDGSDLLSKNLATSPHVNTQLKQEVGLLREKLRQAILHCAIAIEERKYKSTIAEANVEFGMKQKQAALSVINAEKKLHISCQTLQLTVDVFNRLNETIIAEAEKDDRRLFANAVLISELASFLIEYINGYEVEGFADIERLRNESLAHIKATRDKINRNREQLEDTRISPEDRAQREAENLEHEEALNVMEQAWNDWMEDNKGNVNWAHGIRDLVPTLVARRDSAEVRLEVLHGIALLRAVKESAGAMKAATVGVGKLTMKPLPGETVKKLIRGG
jgi:hypothetical protein